MTWAGEGAPPPDWLPTASIDWAHPVPVRAASGKLRIAEKHSFQRACLPYLQALLQGSIVEAPEMQSFDAAGADHLAWTTDSADSLRAVFQCKGWSVSEVEVGPAQAAQCVKSITDFNASPLRTDAYVLLHNRDSRNSEFRDTVLQALEELRRSGSATWTALWSRDDLINAVCDSLAPRLDEAFRTRSTELGQRAARLLGSTLVDTVPLSTSTYRVRNGEIIHDVDQAPVLGDPATTIADTLTDGVGIRVLLGGFGIGKTTTSLRLAANLGRRAIFLPGSLLRADLPDTRTLLWQAVDRDVLLDHIPTADYESIEPLGAVVAAKAMRRPRDDIMLIVDGLDESPLANRSNGLAQIINAMIELRCPVLATMRTEFWHSRQAELQGALPRQNAPNRPLVATPLAAWGDDEVRRLVLAAVEQAATGSDDPDEALHLTDLADLIGTPQFTDLYGDIPRRPLFLRLLIEDVSTEGLNARDPVDLVDGWVRRKLERDWTNPEHLSPGGHQRPSLGDADDTIDTNLAHAWNIMDQAAGLALRPPETHDDTATLAPDITWRALADAATEFSREPQLSALCLSTLLAPTGPVRAGRPARIVFAHRAFQEFFAARWLRQNPDTYPHRPPAAVADWIDRMATVSYP